LNQEQIACLKVGKYQYVPKIIDKNLRRIIAEINLHPDFVTTSCCGGHVKVCRPKVRISSDDQKIWSSDDCLQGLVSIKFEYFDLFCPSSSAPYLQFACTDKYSQFLNHLAQVAGIRRVAKFWKDAAEYSYAYTNDEAYSFDEIDSRNPFTGFHNFWRHFVIGWRKYVDQSSKMKVPNRFQFSKNICNQCNQENLIDIKKNLSDTGEQSLMLKTELFEDDWLDMSCRDSNDDDDD
jgi:hypothetical protein